jgi:hypothetical protein
LNKIILKAVPVDKPSCKGCVFNTQTVQGPINCPEVPCSPAYRNDGKYVIFVFDKVEE